MADQPCKLTSRWRRVSAACLWAALVPRAALGQASPQTVAGAYSPYELASIDDAVSTLKTRVADDPEGKTVEGIDIVTLDVVERRDPAPSALNWFHATTRRYVIEREVLLTEGAP